jgi:hypothetical protein
MASEIIVLPSSPPKQLRRYDMSSSPIFPSPSELFHKKAPVLRGGSRATPIPENASASFTTAGGIFRRTSFDNTLGIGTTRSFKASTGEVNASLTDVTKPKTKAQKPTSKKNDGGGEQVAKPPRKTSTKKKETMEGDTRDKKLRKSRAKKDEVNFDKEGNTMQKAPPKPRAKKAVADHDEEGNIIEKPPPKPRTKKAEAELDEHGNIKRKAVRKPRVETTEGEASAPARKPRAKKLDTNSRAKLPKAQITKPITDPYSDKRAAAPTKSESTSKHFSIANDPVEDVVDYGLAPAIKRRTAWTPPSAFDKSELFDLSTLCEESDGGRLPNEVDTSDESSKRFPDLLSSFAFSSGKASSPKKLSDGLGANKRKLIELVRTNSSTSSASEAAPAQKKAAKKKVRTLTDLATSAYALEDELVKKPAPILQYFSYRTTDRITSDGFKIPPKPRSKSPVKKAGKGTAQAPILLSPGSALKQVGKQDFVFGTSSQLAREESPTFLRDIHAAMQASNEVDEDDPFVDSVLGPAASSTAFIKGKSISSTKRSLWSAAARDTSGEMMDVEMVDMVESPAIGIKLLMTTKEHASLPAEMLSLSAVMSLSDLTNGKAGNEDIWHDLDEIATPPQPTQRVSKSVGPIEAAIREEILNSPAKSINLSGPSPKRSPKAMQPESRSKSAKSPTKSSRNRKTQNAGMPDFSGYTTAQLTKEIASYRFKPIKNRDQMIALLEKCWESKQRMALAALGTNMIMKSSQNEDPKLTKRKSLLSCQIEGTSPKGPRGRPKKDITAISPPKGKAKSKPKTASNIDLEFDSDTPISQIRTPKKANRKGREATENISDSDINMTPSPPRRHLSQIRTSPLPLQTSSATLVEVSPELSPESSQLQLHKYIMRAVRNVLPSTDPKTPTWHEKILLYDPIILEDLTIWLNTGALEKVGWDGEVDPKEVKKWCESKSICCLWKENLRGGVRSRY